MRLRSSVSGVSIRKIDAQAPMTKSETIRTLCQRIERVLTGVIDVIDKQCWFGKRGTHLNVGGLAMLADGLSLVDDCVAMVDKFGRVDVERVHAAMFRHPIDQACHPIKLVDPARQLVQEGWHGMFPLSSQRILIHLGLAPLALLLLPCPL